MNTTPIWKPLAILTVLGLSILALFQGLRPGLDLAGGTTLVYQVQVPPGADPKRTVEDLIYVYSNRVDPNGVRNLTWRPLAGNRIEIQMPLATPEVKALRQTYLDAQQALVAGNITRTGLSPILRLDPPARKARLDELAGDNDTLRAELDGLALAYDRLGAAREPYQKAQDAKRQAEAEAAGLAADAPEAERKAMADTLDRLQAELTARARAFLDARNAFQAIEARIVSGNVDPAEIARVLSLPNELRGGQKTSQRAQALALIKDRHPDRAAAIDLLASAYAAYETQKGPLDDPNDLIALLKGSGVLEFRIAPRPAEVPELDSYRAQLKEKGPRAGANRPFRWFVIDDLSQFTSRKADAQALRADPEAYFLGQSMVGQEYYGQYYLLLSDQRGTSLTQKQGGWRLENAYSFMDPESGFPAVGFGLNAAGGQYMAEMTGGHKGYPMAIVLDGRVISAPNIQSVLGSTIKVTRSAGFSQQELLYMVRTLKAGSTAGSLSENPISIDSTSPTFGQENLRHGLDAVMWSTTIVIVFMVGYYFFSGFVASLAMLFNVVLVLAVMSTIQATFTLAGIAGIVLTIGMAVDANVLIFERIREELEKGSDLHTAIRNGFDRAFVTIIDSNLTTVITCLILGYTATADIRGFAVTLGIGLVANLFTAVFCVRVVLDLYVDLFKPKTLSMLPIAVPPLRRLLTPNINWMKLRYAFAGLSACLVLIALASIYLRGNDFLDIEFRSGTQVSFSLPTDKAMTRQEAVDRIDQAARQAGVDELRGARASVVSKGQAQAGQLTAFTVQTLEQDSDRVGEVIKSAFADSLAAERPIAFAGSSLGGLADAPVYVVRQSRLGGNFPVGPTVSQLAQDRDVSEYLGGVAVVLRDMSPAPTLADLNDRVRRMRLQPSFENLPFRQFTVLGLEAVPGSIDRYTSAVVLTRENDINYLDNPDTFGDAGGLADSEWDIVREALTRDTSLDAVSKFDPAISGTMVQRAIAAIVLSWLAIMGYIWLRFGSLRYGFGAILALVHDVLIAVGLAAASAWWVHNSLGQWLELEPFRLNIALVSAILTLIGYSVNDTIVVFDRIRENRGRLALASTQIINDSINQTLSRTVLTGSTTLLACVCLYLFGGEGVHGFGFVMLVGVVIGTYSSIAIASPLLLIGRADVQPRTAAPAASTSPSTPAKV